MRPISTQPNLRAEAIAETVEDLVGRVRAGTVRVPPFQRPLRWAAEDVIQLFDSIYRGYPIGSFLLGRAAAKAEKIKIGPITVEAPETNSALWVIDGQQRLTALTVGLSRPVPIPTTPIDPWVVYFDAATQAFQAPPKGELLPATWVPVAQLLDASSLSEWVHNWTYSGSSVLRARVFEAGSRIRQYRVPLYIVESSDEHLLKDIFYRVNHFGKRLEWDEVHDALYGHTGDHPSTLKELVIELKKLGMGRPDEKQLLSCLLAFKGLDVTRSLTEHYRRDAEVLKNVVQEALPALRSVLSFLKIHADIPHLRLLPRATPLPVLTRCFTLFPEPKSRTLDLLARWTWRTLLSPLLSDERTLLRRGVSAIKEHDEEGSVQRLLSLVQHDRPAGYILPQQFDARAADSRIALAALSSLKPLDLKDGNPIDVAALIEEIEEFRKIVRISDMYARGPANRVLLPGTGPAQREIVDLITGGNSDSSILHSHAISQAAITALLDKDFERFFQERKKSIEMAVSDLGNRLAGWDRPDRPSISFLLELAGDEK